METIKTAFKGLRSLFRKAPAPMTLNLIGLALSLAAFMLIMTQVIYEHGYDRCYPGYEKIFRIDQSGNDPDMNVLLPSGLAMEFITSSPHIESGSAIPCNDFDIKCNLPNNPEDILDLRIATVEQHFPQVFALDMIEGDYEALTAPDNILIPQSLAKRLFGDSPAIGQPVNIESVFPQGGIYKVGGVYRDLPTNAQIKNLMYMRVPDFLMRNMTASNFMCYIRIDDPLNIDAVLDGFNSTYDFSANPYVSELTAISVKDIYYSGKGTPELGVTTGSRTSGEVMIIVALITLFIGLFNFTSFYTAIIPDRIKALGIRKVNGASTAGLRLGIMTETAVLGCTGWIIAVLLLLVISGPVYKAGLIFVPFSISGGVPLIAVTLAFTLASGLLAGLSPAIFATSFAPGDALKGNFGTSAKGKNLRRTIVCLQYAVSCTLITFVLFVALQNRQMARADTGFAKDEIAMINVDSDFELKYLDAFTTQMMTYPEVAGVAAALDQFGAVDSYSTIDVSLPDGNKITCPLICCTANFPKVMGIDIAEGEDFTENDENGIGALLIGREMHDRYGLSIGDRIDVLVGGEKIKGFTEDMHISSWRTEGAPVCFLCYPPSEYGKNYVYVRFHEGFNAMTAKNHIRQTMNAMSPDIQYEIKLYDEIFSEMYAREIRFTQTVMIFCLLSVFFSLVGIFGLVLFDQQYKRRDIAVRKVFGADDRSILDDGLRPYIVMTIIGFLISVPVAWIVSDWWVSQFGVRIVLSWWVFAVVLAALLLLTWATVYMSHFRTRRMNPVENLKQE